MAWAGLSGSGYQSLILSRDIEMAVAIFVALLHTMY
jgi:hypothetical protein